jgi:hypothetical protein
LHQLPKKLYQETNKKTYEKQIGTYVQRGEQIACIGDHVLKHTNPTPTKANAESLPFSDPNAPYHIGEGTRFSKELSVWLHENQEDPAVKVIGL